MSDGRERVTILNTVVRQLGSKIVGDDYELHVWLPRSYATSRQRYPALYVLDAPFGFGSAIHIALSQSWDNLIPEMIIVGISKQIDTYDQWWPVRSRDYAPVELPGQPDSGHADAFLQSLEEELLPSIDANFRTNPADRAFWGHSLGGVFVLYSLFEKPRLFRRYIATSPAFVIDDATVLDYEAYLSDAPELSEIRLFTSWGSNDMIYGPNVERFANRIRDTQPMGLHFESAVVDGLAHISAAVPGLVRGLPAVFK